MVIDDQKGIRSHFGLSLFLAQQLGYDTTSVVEGPPVVNGLRLDGVDGFIRLPANASEFLN